MEFISLMKKIYEQRDMQRIDELMSLIFDESKVNVIIGTGFGELCVSTEERKSIFINDLKYWDDLHIEDDTSTIMQIGDYQFVSIKASSYSKPFRNTYDENHYENIIKSISENNELTAYQKATEIEWALSCAFIPRSCEEMIEKKPIEINMILEDHKIRFLCFSYVKALNQVDAIYNWTDIRKRYNDFASIKLHSNEKLEQILTKEGFINVQVKMIDDSIFFGIGIKDMTIDLEQQLDEYMKNSIAYDTQSLVKYRRDLAFMLMLYSDKDRPQAVIRFFGICNESGIQMIRYYYPNY